MAGDEEDSSIEVIFSAAANTTMKSARETNKRALEGCAVEDLEQLNKEHLSRVQILL